MRSAQRISPPRLFLSFHFLFKFAPFSSFLRRKFNLPSIDFLARRGKEGKSSALDEVEPHNLFCVSHTLR
jgi:hypothetical protein